MRRRTFLAGLAGTGLLPMGRAFAGEKPFKVSLVGDAYTGDGWLTGIRITLDDGWKTYWRMPGDSGIPPVFGWNGGSGDGLVEVLFPLPATVPRCRRRDGGISRRGHLARAGETG